MFVGSMARARRRPRCVDRRGGQSSGRGVRERRLRKKEGACRDDQLTEPLRQPRSNDARCGIGTATRRKSDYQAHRPRWICLRSRRFRHDRKRGSAGGQMQKLSAGKFHLEPPSPYLRPSSRPVARRRRPAGLQLPDHPSSPGGSILHHHADQTVDRIRGYTLYSRIQPRAWLTRRAGVSVERPGRSPVQPRWRARALTTFPAWRLHADPTHRTNGTPVASPWNE
jgi:hypothetical protein